MLRTRAAGETCLRPCSLLARCPGQGPGRPRPPSPGTRQGRRLPRHAGALRARPHATARSTSAEQSMSHEICERRQSTCRTGRKASAPPPPECSLIHSAAVATAKATAKFPSGGMAGKANFRSAAGCSHTPETWPLLLDASRLPCRRAALLPRHRAPPRSTTASNRAAPVKEEIFHEGGCRRGRRRGGGEKKSSGHRNCFNDEVAKGN